MKIRELELFDLFGDGTLVMKTNMDAEYENLGYAWYVEHKGKVIYKGQYQVKPFTAFQLPHLGDFKVKAFVRQKDGERVILEQTFRADHKTSPKLAESEEQVSFRVNPTAKHISGSFWQFDQEGELPENAKFAWYIYRNGEAEPITKVMYTPESRYIHNFEESGVFHAMLFVLVGNVKRSAVTEDFSVSV